MLHWITATDEHTARQEVGLHVTVSQGLGDPNAYSRCARQKRGPQAQGPWPDNLARARLPAISSDPRIAHVILLNPKPERAVEASAMLRTTQAPNGGGGVRGAHVSWVAC